MFNWLLLVGTNGKPDATGSGLDFHFVEFAIGIILGIFLGALACIMFTSIKDALHTREQKNEDDKQE